MQTNINIIIAKLYQHIDGMQVSLGERERLHISDSSLTYGEILPATFAEMLAVVKPQPGEVFYDLGSGAGKAVFSAALLYDWSKVCGIEFLPGLHQASLDVLQLMRGMADIKSEFPNKVFPISFILDDFLKYDISDADVIYIHATTFGPLVWEPLTVKFDALKSGTRIIVNTKKITSTLFEQIDEQMYMMGWGESTVFTYKKK